MFFRCIVALVIALGAVSSAAPPVPLGEDYAAPVGVGRELLGTRPPEWQVRTWLHSEPLTLAGLRGKVVLIRWWTGPECPYCTASADTLNALWQENRDRGLVVIGMYHHKEAAPLTTTHVVEQARRLRFEFPIGIDEDWTTLRRWWLDSQRRGWTSVTFLLDREGIIRHIHPGGAYFPGEPGYAALQAAVGKALR